MSELRNIPNIAYGAEATNPAHNGISDSIKAAAIIKIADDDAAAAIIRHAHRAEILNIQQDADNGGDTTYKQLADEVAGGRFSLKNMGDQTGKIAAQRSTTMETDNGSLAWLRDDAVQALPWQEDLEPERVLLLLKDVPRQSVAKRVMEQAGVIPGQIISAQESEKA